MDGSAFRENGGDGGAVAQHGFFAGAGGGGEVGVCRWIDGLRTVAPEVEHVDWFVAVGRGCEVECGGGDGVDWHSGDGGLGWYVFVDVEMSEDVVIEMRYFSIP